jgi:hypothetical protein
VKEFMKKAKSFLAGMAVGAGAILLLALTVFSKKGRSGEIRGEKKNDDFTALAGSKRQEAVDAVRATPARTVAERYEGVGDAVDAGRNRFASRVKNRILTAGGRRVDEQHTD